MKVLKEKDIGKEQEIFMDVSDIQYMYYCRADWGPSEGKVRVNCAVASSMGAFFLDLCIFWDLIVTLWCVFKEQKENHQRFKCGKDYWMKFANENVFQLRFEWNGSWDAWRWEQKGVCISNTTYLQHKPVLHDTSYHKAFLSCLPSS